MKNHQIELKELQDWIATQTTIYAQSTADEKKLKITMRGDFIVEHKGKEVYRGMQPYVAVEEYNKI